MGNKESIEYSSPVEYVQRDSFHVGSSVDPSDRNKQHSQFIADNFTSVDQVISALRDAGLESSNLILGIDFTKSNEWTGKYSFHRQSLHAIGGQPNPYEQAISIIGRTLSPFDEDNMIPCFGFGDASTHDQRVFSFFPDDRYCNGFEEALARYREIVPHLKLSGPTSFAPIINTSIDIVERSNGQYHVLVIIADGQVSWNSESVTRPGALSPQEQATINAIVTASQYPLSIILVGVGDGPWDAMQQFDDNIPQRSFDNFQFVNFTKIMSENTEMSKKEAAFALTALMEIPHQYRATQNPQFQRRRTDKIRGSPPRPPPREVIDHDNAVSAFPHKMSFKSTMQNLSTEHCTMSFQSTVPNIPTEQVCPICLTNPKNMAFGCGRLGMHCGRPRERPEPPQPTQTTNHTQTGGGIYNPQIQGANKADGGGKINMGPVISGGSTGRPRERPEPPQPTQTTNHTQTGGGIDNRQIQGANIADGGGKINMGPVICVGSNIIYNLTVLKD